MAGFRSGGLGLFGLKNRVSSGLLKNRPPSGSFPFSGRQFLSWQEAARTMVCFRRFAPTSRAAIALRAMAQGKHVLLEKPGGMNAAELRQLIAARGNDTMLMTLARRLLQPHTTGDGT